MRPVCMEDLVEMVPVRNEQLLAIGKKAYSTDVYRCPVCYRYIATGHGEAMELTRPNLVRYWTTPKERDPALLTRSRALWRQIRQLL